MVLYVAFTVYVPTVALLLGKKLSPLPLTKLMLKLEDWSVPVESTTVHVAVLVISVEPFALAVKKTALPFLVTLWLPGLTVIDVTPCKTTVTVVDPEHAEQLPALAEIVAEPILSPVTWPEVCPTETVVESLDDQVTPEVTFFWLPSLYVPVTLIVAC